MKKEANTIRNEDLKHRKIAAEKKYDEIQKSITIINRNIEKLSRQKTELEVEALRLQGEHRAISELLGDNPEADPEQTLEDNKKDDGNIQSQER